MKSLILAGATALVLTACTNDSELGGLLEGDPARDLLTACGAITGAVNVLAVNKARLSEGQITTVDHVVDTAEPICTATEPPVSRLDLIEDLAVQVSSIQIGG